MHDDSHMRPGSCRAANDVCPMLAAAAPQRVFTGHVLSPRASDLAVPDTQLRRSCYTACELGPSASTLTLRTASAPARLFSRRSASAASCSSTALHAHGSERLLRASGARSMPTRAARPGSTQGSGSAFRPAATPPDRQDLTGLEAPSRQAERGLSRCATCGQSPRRLTAAWPADSGPHPPPPPLTRLLSARHRPRQQTGEAVLWLQLGWVCTLLPVRPTAVRQTLSLCQCS